MPSVYDPWVDDLLAGVDGATVVEAMRAHYAAAAKAKGKPLNECTLRSKMTVVKTRLLLATPKRGQRNVHPTYRRTIAALRKAGASSNPQCAAAVTEFLGMSTPVQAKEVKYRDKPNRDRISICRRFDDPRVARAWKKLRVLPENLYTFRMEDEEFEACKRRSDRNLLHKETVAVKDATTILDATTEALEKPDEVPIYAVIAALLFASGRRTAELLNGKSTFEPIPGYTHGCWFEGQLKSRKHVNELPFKIPLLVPFELFDAGLSFVREWQGDMETIRALSNAKVSQRYQPNLQRYLTKSPLGGVGERPHLLRSLYMRYVLVMFDWRQHSRGRVAKYCLGHAQLKQGAHYDAIDIEYTDAIKKSMGVFPLSDEELEEVESLVHR